MRAILLCLGFIASFMALPAGAQWLPNGLTFAQGSVDNEVEFGIPVPAEGITGFEGLTLSFTYDGRVFEPLALTRIPTSNDKYFDFDGSFVGTPAPNCTVCVVTISLLADPDLSFPFGATIPGPGTLYQARVRFNILPDAPLGLTTVTAGFDAENGFSGSLPVQATIAAVPEPETWAMMLAGLALTAMGVRRSRRRRALPSV